MSVHPKIGQLWRGRATNRLVRIHWTSPKYWIEQQVEWVETGTSGYSAYGKLPLSEFLRRYEFLES